MALTEKNLGKPTVDNGIATVECTDDDAFFNEAKEAGIDKDILKKVDKFKKSYIDNGTEIAANNAKDIMLGDKKIDKVITKFPYSTSSKGAVEVITTRSVTTNIPGTDRKVTKSGIKVAVIDPNTKATKASIGKLKTSLTEALLS